MRLRLLRISRRRPLRWVGTLHVEIFRNAPDYIMVVWVHFVLPLLIGVVLHAHFELNPFVSAIIALGFVYSGYFAETFRAGIEAVPAGQIEAGRSCGMSERLILWRIVLPQVVRRMLPESVNQFISLFKATTIVSLIAVPDLMYRGVDDHAAGNAAAAAVHRRSAAFTSRLFSSPATR